ncbi:MAG: glycerate kinase [Planctomycetes bacterium]|nr:glycerate kinase [Planctomycetota bacterium]
MKIIAACDSFKGSIDAKTACAAVARGVRRVCKDAQVIELPMADGGEGTLEAIVAATKGRLQNLKVSGPFGEQIEAAYGITGDGNRCIIEVSRTAGLPMIPKDKRDPLKVTTYGLGEMILAGLEGQCRQFIIGLGGSACNDCGCGMAQALGVRFLDQSGNQIKDKMTGGLLAQVGKIDISQLPKQIDQCDFLVACDVTNPLLGDQGASRVYAPQKGADKKTVEILEANMTHIIDLIEEATGRKVRDIPGAGSSGGLGAAVMAFLKGRLMRGVEIVMEQTGFADKITDADLIITGEGQIDSTTLNGKTLSGIAKAAKKQGTPIVALAGTLGKGWQAVHELGITAVIPICDSPMTLEAAMTNAELLIEQAAERTLRLIQIK